MSRIICIPLILAFIAALPSRTSGDLVQEVAVEGIGVSEYTFSGSDLITRQLFGLPFRTFRVAASSTEFSISIETRTLLSPDPITQKGFKLRFPAR